MTCPATCPRCHGSGRIPARATIYRGGVAVGDPIDYETDCPGGGLDRWIVRWDRDHVPPPTGPGPTRADLK